MPRRALGAGRRPPEAVVVTRVWLFGSHGFVGRAVHARLLRAGHLVSVPRLGADRLRGLDEYFPGAPGNVVVNCAGVSGSPNVDWCESHRAETVEGNTLFPLALARRPHAHLVHVGSGCVFFGENPRGGSSGAWGESDPANPRTVYTRSKYAADLGLQALTENLTILRPRLVFSGEPGPRNALTKIAGYRRVIDVVNSVTHVEDLAEAVAFFVQEREPGVFHAVSVGSVSHREIIDLYRKHVDPDHDVEFIRPEDLGVVAERSSVRLHSSIPRGLFDDHAVESVERALVQYGRSRS